MNSEHGFTLIELMIVIAIIGIISSIALPQYANYVGRAQAVEGFQLASGLQNEVDIWHNTTGAFPEKANIHPTTGYIGIIAGALEGKYTKNNAIRVTADLGIINIPFDAGTNKGTIMQMTPTVNSDKVIVWMCGGTIDITKLPSSCQ